MEMDFVSFDLAKKLKEKGFRELCLAYYTNDDRLWFNHSHKAGATYSDCYISHNLMPKGSVSGKFVDAPTISQVLKWLREKGIFIEIHVHATFATKNKVAYWCRICRNSNGMRIKQIDELEASYADYEKAAMGGIEYVIDNLI